jgi:hypothetical protein
MSSRENSVTGLIAQYLRQQGVSTNTFESLEIPGQGVKEPDFAVHESGHFYGEAKWEDEYNRGIVEATEYQQAPKANGTFAIAYPNELKKAIQQQRLTNDVESILEGYNFPVTFLRKDGNTDMRTVSITELPGWLNDQIEEESEPITEAEEVVKILRQAANALTREAPEVEAIDLFENVLGIDAEEGEKAESARRVVGYLLVNQIVFYRVLSSATEFKSIDVDSISSPSDLNDYFDRVLQKDYTPIFGMSVAEFYEQQHLPLIKEAVRSTYIIDPERLHHEVLGDIFHALIPKSLRKSVAAYYTKNKAAHLLAGLAVEDSDTTILDPACGTGTLLTSAYRAKRDDIPVFSESDHKQFLEEDITGIDIMPFAAHLATIHLALQNPQYETDRVRVGIEDSTNLQPGDKVSPLSKMLPEDEIQRTFDTFDKSIEEFEKEKVVERGGIARKGMEQSPLNLGQVDLVIMNPPYSRQEVMSNFGEDYKSTLKRNRLRKYEQYIDKRMNFYSYFLLLADRFVGEDGRIAAVTSVGLLNIDTDRGVRELLDRRYNIEYIFIRDDESSFSEDTDRREVMTVLKKGEASSTNFVRLNSLDIGYHTIESVADDLEAGENIQREKFSINKVTKEDLNFDNLFAPFAVQNPELVQILSDVLKSPKVTRIEDLEPGIIRGAQAGAYDPRGYNPEMTIHAPNPYKYGNKDMWVLSEEKNDSINAKHRLSGDEFEIPRENVVPNMRRFTGRWKADLSDLNEYAVTKRFDEFDKFESLTKEDDIPVEAWESRVNSRLSHIALMRRGDIAAPGTAHMAFYSDSDRLWPGTMWVLNDVTEAEAKILTAFLDSTIGWLQFFINRIETRGSFAEWHKYMIEILRVINPSSISEDEREKLIGAVEKYGSVETPSVVQQLASLTPKDTLSKEEQEKLQDTFSDLHFGKGLEQRRDLDKAVLSVLDIPESEQSKILSKLYPELLKEIFYLKQMMDSD